MDPLLSFSRPHGCGKGDEIFYDFERKIFDVSCGEYTLASSLKDQRSTADVNVYKDVIKKLIEDVNNLRRENFALKKMVLSFTKRLPQAIDSLSSLSAAIGGEASRFFARKTWKSEDESDYSATSVQESLIKEGIVESDLNCKTSHEELRQGAASKSINGVHHSHQNFDERISTKDNDDDSRVNVCNGVIIKRNCNIKYKEVQNCQKEYHDINDKTYHNNISTRNEKDLKQNEEITSIANEKLQKYLPMVAEQNKSKRELKGEEGQKKSFELTLEKLRGKMEINSQESNGRKVAELKQESVALSNFAQMSVKKKSTEPRHNQRRIFSCDICGRTFSRSSNLAHHAMRHRNERPYQCKICNRAFVQKANLKVHLRSHTGERPYPCNECGKAFAQKNNALRHLRAHARQRQYQQKNLECFL